MSGSSTLGRRFLRALPRLLLIAFAVAFVLWERSILAAACGVILVVSRLLDLPAWWHYVVTGERQVARKWVAAQYAVPGRYGVELLGAGERPLEVIKAVREVNGSGLAEAKGIVTGAPAPIVAGLSEQSAQRVADRIRRAGAEVRVVASE